MHNGQSHRHMTSAVFLFLHTNHLKSSRTTGQTQAGTWLWTPGVVSPGISERRWTSIHCLFHSLCPLGLITFNLTPCLSDSAVRSAGVGEMFTKSMDHQHFDCGTPDGHFSHWDQWANQSSLPVCSMISRSVVTPSPRTWKPKPEGVSFRVCHFCHFLSPQILFGVLHLTDSPCGLVYCVTLCTIWSLPAQSDCHVCSVSSTNSQGNRLFNHGVF